MQLPSPGPRGEPISRVPSSSKPLSSIASWNSRNRDNRPWNSPWTAGAIGSAWPFASQRVWLRLRAWAQQPIEEPLCSAFVFTVLAPTVEVDDDPLPFRHATGLIEAHLPGFEGLCHSALLHRVRLTLLPTLTIFVLIAFTISLRILPGQPERIRRTHRISLHVGVGIDPALEPYRIALQIPADLRIVIPEIVVVQIGLFIEVLSREAQVQREGLTVAIGILYKSLTRSHW